MHFSNKDKVLRNIRIQMWTIVLVEMWGMAYTMIVYFVDSEHCSSITKFTFLNQLIWLMDRGSSNIFWIYPFLYLWWPENKSKCQIVSSQVVDYYQPQSK